MLSTQITIERSPEAVWEYLTEPQNWKTWWGGGLKSAQWREGGELDWEVGGTSRIEAIVPGKMVRMAGPWMSTTFTVKPARAGDTTVEIEESALRGGASFSDGGKAHLAELHASLVRLKEQLEDQPEGIGGWLLLPAIGIVLNPLSLLYAAISEVRLLADLARFQGWGFWELFRGVNAYAKLSVLGSLALLVYSIVLAVQFFGKKAQAKKTFVYFLIALAAYRLLLLILAIVFSFEEMGTEIANLVGSLGAMAIWIPYFQRSKRVANTFVN